MMSADQLAFYFECHGPARLLEITNKWRQLLKAEKVTVQEARDLFYEVQCCSVLLDQGDGLAELSLAIDEWMRKLYAEL